MKTVKICGIDPSTKACGKCIMEVDPGTFDVISVKLYAYHPTKIRSYVDDRLRIDCVGSKYEKMSIPERQMIAYKIMDIDMEDVKFVAFEGYAYSKAKGGGGSNSRGMVQLAEFIGTMKYRFFKQGKGLLIYPPTTIKKFATSDGTADKLKMQFQFKNDHPDHYHEYLDKITDWENPCSDIVDAYWICEALRVHMKYDVFGSEALTPVELFGVQSHTAASSPLCETPILIMPNLT